MEPNSRSTGRLPAAFLTPGSSSFMDFLGHHAPELLPGNRKLPPVQGALDQIVQRFGTEQVAEITGRSRRIVRKGERLTVENGTDRVAIYGSLDLTRDKQGLAHALALKAVLDQAVQLLQAERNLPDAAPPATNTPLP